jgi:predicted RecB family nuclease
MRGSCLVLSIVAAIEWVDRWTTERDPAIYPRTLEYSEDGCRATRVLLDGLRSV